jgi:hypothetical protein
MSTTITLEQVHEARLVVAARHFVEELVADVADLADVGREVTAVVDLLRYAGFDPSRVLPVAVVEWLRAAGVL